MGAGRSLDARGHAWVARPQALARAREPEPQGPRPRVPRAPLLSTGAVSACSLAEEVVRKRLWARQEAAAPAARLRLEAPSVFRRGREPQTCSIPARLADAEGGGGTVRATQERWARSRAPHLPRGSRCRRFRSSAPRARRVLLRRVPFVS